MLLLYEHFLASSPKETKERQAESVTNRQFDLMKPTEWNVISAGGKSEHVPDAVR